jgi:hypothetical protein
MRGRVARSGRTGARARLGRSPSLAKGIRNSDSVRRRNAPVPDTCDHGVVFASMPAPHECGSRPARGDAPAIRQQRGGESCRRPALVTFPPHPRRRGKSASRPKCSWRRQGRCHARGCAPPDDGDCGSASGVELVVALAACEAWSLLGTLMTASDRCPWYACPNQRLCRRPPPSLGVALRQLVDRVSVPSRAGAGSAVGAAVYSNRAIDQRAKYLMVDVVEAFEVQAPLPHLVRTKLPQQLWIPVLNAADEV